MFDMYRVLPDMKLKNIFNLFANIINKINWVALYKLNCTLVQSRKTILRWCLGFQYSFNIRPVKLFTLRSFFSVNIEIYMKIHWKSTSQLRQPLLQLQEIWHASLILQRKWLSSAASHMFPGCQRTCKRTQTRKKLGRLPSSRNQTTTAASRQEQHPPPQTMSNSEIQVTS